MSQNKSKVRYIVPLDKFALYQWDESKEKSDVLKISVNGPSILNIAVFTADSERIFGAIYSLEFVAMARDFAKKLEKEEGPIKLGITAEKKTKEGDTYTQQLMLVRNNKGVCLVHFQSGNKSSVAFKFAKFRGRDYTSDGESISNQKISSNLMATWLESIARVTESVTSHIAMRNVIELADDNQFKGAGNGGGGNNNNNGGGNTNCQKGDEQLPY